MAKEKQKIKFKKYEAAIPTAEGPATIGVIVEKFIDDADGVPRVMFREERPIANATPESLEADHIQQRAVVEQRHAEELAEIDVVIEDIKKLKVKPK